MRPAIKHYLEKIYYDPKNSGGYSGIENLFRAVKKDGKHEISRDTLKEFLKTQETYGVHRKSINKFTRPKVVTSGLGIQADVDLMDMSSLSDFNDNYKYVLVYIDVFSKFVKTVPLRTKTGLEVKEAFRKLAKDGGLCQIIRSDPGGEFVNKHVQGFFKEQGVKFVKTLNVPKASIAERVIKTLKSKLSKYRTKFQTNRYIDILASVTEAYNGTYHRSIKMSPNQVTRENESEVFSTLYGDRHLALKGLKPFRYKVGDHVRVSVTKHPFTREYHEKFGYEVFKILHRDRIQSIPVYSLEDLTGEAIAGRFYSNQLQDVTYSEDDVFKIDKVLKTRKLKGRPPESYVSWYGWSRNHNSWIPSSQVEDIRKNLEKQKSQLK